MVQSIDLPEDRQCNTPWLYYGVCPQSNYNPGNEY